MANGAQSVSIHGSIKCGERVFSFFFWRFLNSLYALRLIAGVCTKLKWKQCTSTLNVATIACSCFHSHFKSFHKNQCALLLYDAIDLFANVTAYKHTHTNSHIRFTTLNTMPRRIIRESILFLQLVSPYKYLST